MLISPFRIYPFIVHSMFIMMGLCPTRSTRCCLFNFSLPVV